MGLLGLRNRLWSRQVCWKLYGDQGALPGLLQRSFRRTPRILIRRQMITVDPLLPCPEGLPLLLSRCCGQQLGVFRCRLSGQKSERFRQAWGCSHATRINRRISAFHRHLPARFLNGQSQPVALTWGHPSSPGEERDQRTEGAGGRAEGGQEQAGAGGGGAAGGGSCVSA